MMMEETRFKKDETPYYVFTCSKCKQYIYVKTTQKTKKCLRCGRTHQVKNITFISEIINGITAAKDRVIILQGELARKDLGFEPALRAINDFSLNLPASKEMLKPKDGNNNNASKVKNILNSLNHQYRKYPYYLIELAAQDKGISKKEIRFLISTLLNKGILKKTSRELYYLT